MCIDINSALKKRVRPTAVLHLVGLLGRVFDFRLSKKRKLLPTNASVYRVTKHATVRLYNFSFPSMYRRLKSTRLIQCYERKQI